MRHITDTEFAKLKEQYPEATHDLVKIELRMGDIVIRTPTEPEWGMFQGQRLSDEQKKLAFPNLLTMCCVFPPKEELAAGLKRWPGITNNIKVLRALQYVSGEADALEGKG
jgi:hypothetical protein